MKKSRWRRIRNEGTPVALVERSTPLDMRPCEPCSGTGSLSGGEACPVCGGGGMSHAGALALAADGVRIPSPFTNKKGEGDAAQVRETSGSWESPPPEGRGGCCRATQEPDFASPE